MSAKQRNILFVLVGLVLLVNVAGTRQWFTAPYPGHNDFLSTWEPSRSFWIDGIPAYSEQSNLNLQTRIYGRAAQEDEIPNRFAYPFYTAIVLWPLVHLPYDWASAVWMVFLEVCLLVALGLTLNLYRWKPGPMVFALLALWALFSYPAARNLLLGQVGALVYVCQVLAIWALFRKRDTVGGLALALSTLKPQMSYLIVPLLLLWALRERRWRYVSVFTITMTVLLGLSFALQPTWVGDWLAELRLYPSYTAVGSPVWVITRHFLGLGSAGEWLVNGALYAFVLWTWIRALRPGGETRLLWTIMLTLTVTHLVAPRTATTHFVVFTVPAMFYAAHWLRRRRPAPAVLLLGLMFIVPWAHFLLTVEGEFEPPATYLPLPVSMLLLLWFTRHRWYSEASSATMVTEPRTLPTVSS